VKVGTQPGVEAVRLKHQQTGKTAHPVDVGKALQGMCSDTSVSTLKAGFLQIDPGCASMNKWFLATRRMRA
jgi:hypothetical protein